MISITQWTARSARLRAWRRRSARPGVEELTQRVVPATTGLPLVTPLLNTGVELPVASPSTGNLLDRVLSQPGSLLAQQPSAGNLMDSLTAPQPGFSPVQSTPLGSVPLGNTPGSGSAAFPGSSTVTPPAGAAPIQPQPMSRPETSVPSAPQSSNAALLPSRQPALTPDPATAAVPVANAQPGFLSQRTGPQPAIRFSDVALTNPDESDDTEDGPLPAEVSPPAQPPGDEPPLPQSAPFDEIAPLPVGRQARAETRNLDALDACFVALSAADGSGPGADADSQPLFDAPSRNSKVAEVVAAVALALGVYWAAHGQQEQDRRDTWQAAA